MASDSAMRFVTELARELSSGGVNLPSLPDVVLKIRSALEGKASDFEQIAQLIGTDAVLVSRLLVFANSSAYNPTGEKVRSLDVAIGRLGLELVRNTAIALAVKQLYLGEQHKAIAGQVRLLWGRSMQLAALAHSIAIRASGMNAETAYLCGLVHEVGKLYILTKSRDYPDFIGDAVSIAALMDDWHPKIGKSILEAWKFSAEVSESADPRAYLDDHTHVAPTYADVMFVAERMLAAETDGAPNFATMPSSVRLGITNEVAAEVLVSYREKLLAVRETLTQAA